MHSIIRLSGGVAPWRRIARRLLRTFAAALAGLCLSITAIAAAADPAERVLTLGGAVTEIVYALGQQDRLVARDTTSSFPAAAEDLPDVGYVRALSPEGVLSVGPDLIIATEGSGPLEAIEVIKEAGVEFVEVPEGFDQASILQKIEIVAAALDVPEKGALLAERVAADLTEATSLGALDHPPRVLFVLSMQGGRIMAAGADTGAEGIIELAGGVNAMEGFDGYKQVADEAVLDAAPDVILMMDRGGDHSASDIDILTHPALGLTPAAETQAFVRLPGLLMLGFGPRTPEAVRALNEAFRGSQG